MIKQDTIYVYIYVRLYLYISKKVSKSILNSLKTITIFTLPPLEFARQLAIRDNLLYRSVKLEELILMRWTKSNKNDLAPNVLSSIQQFCAFVFPPLPPFPSLFPFLSLSFSHFSSLPLFPVSSSLFPLFLPTPSFLFSSISLNPPSLSLATSYVLHHYYPQPFPLLHPSPLPPSHSPSPPLPSPLLLFTRRPTLFFSCNRKGKAPSCSFYLLRRFPILPSTTLLHYPTLSPLHYSTLSPLNPIPSPLHYSTLSPLHYPTPSPLHCSTLSPLNPIPILILSPFLFLFEIFFGKEEKTKKKGEKGWATG